MKLRRYRLIEVKSILSFYCKKYGRIILKESINLCPVFILEYIINWKSKKTHYPPVLMYHYIDDVPQDYLHVSPENFEKMMVYLKQQGYEFLFENQYCQLNRKAIIITFDDGYADNYYNMFPIVQKIGCKVSINIITDQIDANQSKYLNREQICEMYNSGVIEFESHTCSHIELINCSEEELLHELRNSKEQIKEKIGKDCSCIAYPRNQANSRVREKTSKFYKFAFGGAAKSTGTNYINRIQVENGTTKNELCREILRYL